MAQSESFRFLELPTEVRFLIYHEVLFETRWIHPSLNYRRMYHWRTSNPQAILAVCRQIRRELYDEFLKNTVLVMDVLLAGRLTGAYNNSIRSVAIGLGHRANLISKLRLNYTTFVKVSEDLYRIAAGLMEFPVDLLKGDYDEHMGYCLKYMLRHFPNLRRLELSDELVDHLSFDNKETRLYSPHEARITSYRGPFRFPELLVEVIRGFALLEEVVFVSEVTSEDEQFFVDEDLMNEIQEIADRGDGDRQVLLLNHVDDYGEVGIGRIIEV